MQHRRALYVSKRHEQPVDILGVGVPAARADAHAAQLLMAADVNSLHGVNLVAVPEQQQAVGGRRHELVLAVQPLRHGGET